MIDTVTLLSNPKKNVPRQAAEEIVNVLIKGGAKQIRTDNQLAYLTEVSDKVVIRSDDALFEKSGLIVVMGGDGSIIDAARRSAHHGVPITSINFGRIGYLAELDYSERELLCGMLNGDFKTEERMMLEVTVTGKEEKCTLISLNDVVLSNGPISRLSFFELWCSGTEVAKYSADGIVICTPTGSSAYSLSAGGPLIYQSMECICATPICPHSMTMRPIVFDADAVIELKNPYCRENKMFITVDGRDNVEIFPGDIVTVKKSPLKTRLARIKSSSFVDVLHGKLAEASKAER